MKGDERAGNYNPGFSLLTLKIGKRKKKKTGKRIKTSEDKTELNGKIYA